MVCTFRRAFPLTHYGDMGCRVSKGGTQNKKYFFTKLNKLERRRGRNEIQKVSACGLSFNAYKLPTI